MKKTRIMLLTVATAFIHLKTGKVVGIAMCARQDDDPVTHVQYLTPVIWSDCIRADNIKGWQNMDWKSFYAQAVRMREIGIFTSDLSSFFINFQAQGGIKAEDYKSRAMLQCFRDLARDMGDQRVPGSDADQEMAYRGFATALKNASQADITDARRNITYDFFLRELAGQQKMRDAMANEFKALVDKYTP